MLRAVQRVQTISSAPRVSRSLCQGKRFMEGVDQDDRTRTNFLMAQSSATVLPCTWGFKGSCKVRALILGECVLRIAASECSQLSWRLALHSRTPCFRQMISSGGLFGWYSR